MVKNKYADVRCNHIYRLLSGDLVTLKLVDPDPNSAYPYAPYPAPDHNKLNPFPARRFDNEKWNWHGEAMNSTMNDIVEEFFPNVDLTKCVGGEELIDRHGYHLIYVGLNQESPFPHTVIYPDGSLGTRCDNGSVYAKRPLWTDHDIVEVLKVLPHKVLLPPEPNII